MPEQKNGYMAELDAWTENNILAPLYGAWHDVQEAPDTEIAEECQNHLNTVILAAKRAVREKVLESYRNGQHAGPTKPARRPK